MRITIFAPTVIGYIAWPQALYTRGLAAALARRGHDVRVVEERRNAFYTETLRAAGSEPARQFFEEFREIQHHSYEPRSGARLFEWVAREIALLDVAVAVDGIDAELAGWLRNIDHVGLTRVFVSFDRAFSPSANFDLTAFDYVLSPQPVPGLSNWRPLPVTIVDADHERFADTENVSMVAADEAVDAFERVIAGFDGEPE